MTTTTQTHPQTLGTFRISSGASRARTAAVWILSVAAAGMFLMAGWGKLSGAPQMVGLYDVIGVGQWFRYLTGAIEVGAALALFVPSVAAFAAAALAATMVGAIATHLFIIGGSVAIPVALLAATSFIAWTRWTQR
jgi:putative oxidoreductase